jgi:putative ABC transport system permease protein
LGVIWHKVWYDLWHNKLRTLLVILSIAVGVFALGTTFGLAEQMLPAMDSAHQSSVPSHATLYLIQPVARDTLLSLRKIPGVANVEALNLVQIRWKKHHEDEWRVGALLQRDDYAQQTYDIVQLKAGAWPLEQGLSIERMHSPFYDIDIGDKIIIEVGDQERTFPITGKIRHPFVPPPSMYDQAWFFGGTQVMELFGIPDGKFAQIKIRATPYSSDNAKVVASAVKERLAKQGIGVASTVYQDPQKHWGRLFVDGMTLVIEVLAVVSMLLSVVLVLNTLTAVITQQTNQIGIMKAIGGSSLTITKVYLVGVLVYGLLSLLIAFPLGAIASFRVSQWFLGLYNIDYDSYSLSTRTLIVEAFAALAVPLLGGLFPVMSAATITVRQAIASYGLGGDFRSNWIDRLVERIGQRFLVSYNAMALSNTFRRKGRLLLTQLVLVMAGVMFLMVMTLSSSITATNDAEFGRHTYDAIFNLEDMQRLDRTRQLVQSVSGVEKADMWLALPASILHQGQKTLDAGLGAQLQGVPLDDPMYRPLIAEGRWFEPGDDRVVVMNKQTADDNHIRLGDTISLDLGVYGQDEWKVIGLYRVFLMFGGGFSTDALYAPRPAVFEVTKKVGKCNTLLVRMRAHSMEEVTNITGLVQDRLKADNIGIAQSETMPTLRKTSDTSMSFVIIMLLVLAVIVALVGGIGLMGSLWISVIERGKEIGIMRAIGASSGHILGMFILEGVIQGSMSWVFAVPISLLVTPMMANALGQTMFKSALDYQFNFGATLAWLGIVLVISVLASAIPARNASGINVRQSLTYE